jgi:hypothetical protein
VNSNPSSNPKVAEVVKTCTSIVPASSDLKDFNESYLRKHKSSAAHVLGAVRGRRLLDGSSTGQNEQDVAAMLDCPGVSIKEAEDGLRLLKEWKSAESVIAGFESRLKKKWPHYSGGTV